MDNSSNIKDLNYFANKCISIAADNAKSGRGGPFAAMVIKGNKIISQACNLVTDTCDPTAHAEVVAIRKACNVIDNFSLAGYTLISSAEPCPMCLMASYWARVEKVYYLAPKELASKVGFDDSFLYEEMAKNPKERKLEVSCLDFSELDPNLPFEEWSKNSNRVNY